MTNRNLEEVSAGGAFTETRYITVPQVAAGLQVSMDWVYSNWRKLGGIKLGGKIRFIDNEIGERIKELNQHAKTAY